MKYDLLIISGPSAGGKTTVAEKILELDDRFCLTHSVTTRERRSDGFDSEYHYKSESEFFNMVDDGELLEYTQYKGHYYGTPYFELDAIIKKGKLPLLILDLNGVKAIKSEGSGYNAFSAYVYDSLDVTEKRLYARAVGADGKMTIEAFETYKKRTDKNTEDFLMLPELTDDFDIMPKNITVEDTAAEILKSFGISEKGISPDRDTVKHTAYLLFKEATEKKNKN